MLFTHTISFVDEIHADRIFFLFFEKDRQWFRILNYPIITYSIKNFNIKLFSKKFVKIQTKQRKRKMDFIRKIWKIIIFSIWRDLKTRRGKYILTRFLQQYLVLYIRRNIVFPLRGVGIVAKNCKEKLFRRI